MEAEKNDLEMLTEDLIMDNAHKSTLPHVRKNVTIIRRLIIKSENILYILLVFMCVYIYIIYIYDICIHTMNYQHFSLVFYKASGFVNSSTESKVIQGFISFLILKIKS